MSFGEKASEEVRLTGTLANSARLAIVAVEPAGPEVSVVPPGDGRTAGVRVTMAGTRVGHAAGQMLVATGLEEPADLTLLYSWRVVGNLRVDPTNPFIDVRAAVPEVVIRVSSSRRDFRLDAATVSAGPFEADVVRDAADGYAVHVRFAVDRLSADQRGSLGTLRLISNDPAEPEKDVPLVALGRP